MVTYLCCVFTLFAGVFVFAQKLPEPKPSGPGDPPGLPVDGGLSLLFIAGAAYGVYASKKKLTIDD